LHEHLLAQVGIGQSALQLSLADSQTLVRLLSQAHSEIKYAALPQLPLELALLTFAVPSEPTVIQTTTVTQEKIIEKPQTPVASIKKEPEDGSTLWESLISVVKRENHSLAGIMRGCQLQDMDETTITISTAYAFHKDKLENLTARAILSKASKTITGKDMAIAVVLKTK